MQNNTFSFQFPFFSGKEMFALQRVPLKSGPWSWPIQVRSDWAQQGARSLGSCPPKSLSRPTPSRGGSGTGGEKQTHGKILEVFDRDLQKPFSRHRVDLQRRETEAEQTGKVN